MRSLLLYTSVSVIVTILREWTGVATITVDIRIAFECFQVLTGLIIQFLLFPGYQLVFGSLHSRGRRGALGFLHDTGPSCLPLAMTDQHLLVDS